MDINNMEHDAGAAIYYDPVFKAVLEDHMTNLRTDPEARILDLEENKVYQWLGDLFGLLRSYSVEPRYYWIIMRMNSMDSPTDLSEEHKTLLMPGSATIRKILNQYQTMAKTTL